MIDYSCCKVNLGLEIVSKREDGFHNIESVIYPVPLFDIIDIIPNKGGFQLSQSGIIVDGLVEDNLIYKAWNLINTKYKFGGVKVHLHKQVPMGAGLGGGSANATKMLQMLNKEFKLNIRVEELLEMASEIGSDCPFFIYNKPVYAYNTGVDFKPLDLDLSNYYIVIIKPKISISTAEAYSGIRPTKSKIDLEKINSLDLSYWRGNITNGFETKLFIEYPELAKIKESLYKYGAKYASMSGSGSAIYGLFLEEIDISKFSKEYFVWQGKLG